MALSFKINIKQDKMRDAHYVKPVKRNDKFHDNISFETFKRPKSTFLFSNSKHDLWLWSIDPVLTY